MRYLITMSGQPPFLTNYFEYKKTLNIYTSGVFVNTKFIEVSFNSVVEFIKWYNKI